MDVFTPVPLNKRELVSPVDVFIPVLEIRNAGSPVDIFTPVPLNKRELVSLGDCISPTPRNWKSWNIQWMFLAQVNIHSC